MRDIRFEMRFPPALIARIDAWRDRQVIPPARAAAVRYMIERGLTDEDGPRTGSPIANIDKDNAHAHRSRD